MGREMTTKVNCADCGADLPAEWVDRGADNPCPTCGSSNQHIQLGFTDNLGAKIHDSLRAKVKDPALPSKKNPRLDVFVGDDLRNADGKWMRKESVIDRDKNHYKETVVDPETGEVIHHNEESLSDHVGHGSNKPSKADPA